MTTERQSAPRPALDRSARRGRALFFAGLALYSVWELTVLGFQIAFDSPLIATSVARMVPGFGLFFFVWRGRTWAVLLLTLAALVTFLAGWSTALSGGYGLEVGGLIASFGTLFFGWTLALHFAPPAKAYLRFQRDHD